MGTRKPKAPPPELSDEAKAICDVMGWEYDTSTKIAEGNVALGIIRDLTKAGWRLFPVPLPIESYTDPQERGET